MIKNELNILVQLFSFFGVWSTAEARLMWLYGLHYDYINFQVRTMKLKTVIRCVTAVLSALGQIILWSLKKTASKLKQ